MEKKFSRSFEELKEIVAFTTDVFQRLEIDNSMRYVVDLCIEELFVNMVTYDTETDEDISIEISPHPDGVQVALTDRGVDRFDPTEGPKVDIDAPLEQRTPGGLGLYLVLKMVDSIHYEYRDRVSKITFVASGKNTHVSD